MCLKKEKDGNAPCCGVAAVAEKPKGILTGKTVIFLGSSVTQGSAAKDESFVDFLQKQNGLIAVKEAVPGTTLADLKDSSYISRLKRMEFAGKADAFVCQLSTNDARKDISLGEIAGGTDLCDFDTATVAGAIEYIIAYARERFGCPVVFYTGTRYDSPRYGEMVALLLQIAEKWHITVLDLWNDEAYLSVDPADYAFYMADGVHPKRAGYGLWWTPAFEACLTALFREKEAANENNIE